jgi:hypothetical protein
MTFPDPQLQSTYAQHVCDFERRIATETAYNPDGSLAYALGQGFIEEAGLNDADLLQHYGIAQIWFGRYFQRNVKLPTLTPNEFRDIPQSQVKLAVEMLDGQSWSSDRETALKAHIYKHLNLSSADVDTFSVETDKTCCHSPCFGCTCFDVHTAIANQGRTPWLNILEAKALEQTATKPEALA